MAGCWHLFLHTKSSRTCRQRAHFRHLLQSTGTQVKIQSSGNMTSSEEQLKKFSTAESPIDVLTNSPEKSEFYRELPLKGIKTNLFYITDLTKTSLANISADDNGAY